MGMRRSCISHRIIRGFGLDSLRYGSRALCFFPQPRAGTGRTFARCLMCESCCYQEQCQPFKKNEDELMRKPGKHTYRLLCLILALAGLMIGATLAPEPAGRISAQVVSPRSIATGNLNIARRLHTATLLLNGKVLVTGGIDNAIATLNSAELYDPATGRWSVTGSLNALRIRHTATLLADGKVLVAGGQNNAGGGGPLDSAELYDPTTGIWSSAGNLNKARSGHTATL